MTDKGVDTGSISQAALQGAPAQTDDNKSLALALSGGGLRATLFHIGILLYLALLDELKYVNAVVSVSGGSILAAHLATRWAESKRSSEDFIRVASNLVRFIRRDIRNSAMVPWIWSRCLLITWLMPQWRRSAYLQQQYEGHFGETTLGDLLSATATRSVFVATDTVEHRRVALMGEGITRFDFEGEADGEPILAKGVHLALAVAASSCFPPVFESLNLTYRELGITFEEFRGSLTLNDGGVAGNLGVEVLSNLTKLKTIVAHRMLVCDAERSLVEKPVAGLLASINAEGAALSAAARQVVQQLGSNALLVRFAHRSPEESYLPFRVQTKLFNYRTDLDQPSWQECHALIMHGAANCQRLFASDSARKCDPHDVRAAIRKVLEMAGSPKELPTPSEADLRRCGKRSYRRLLVHGALALALFLTACASASEAAAFLRPSLWAHRPLMALYRLMCPEQIWRREVDNVADILASATCDNSIDKVDPDLLQPRLSQMAIVVGANPTSSVLYVKKLVRPLNCNHPVSCELAFRLAKLHKQIHEGEHVTVTGRNGSIYMTELRTTVYMDFNECEVTRSKSE